MTPVCLMRRPLLARPRRPPTGQTTQLAAHVCQQHMQELGEKYDWVSESVFWTLFIRQANVKEAVQPKHA